MDAPRTLNVRHVLVRLGPLALLALVLLTLTGASARAAAGTHRRLGRCAGTQARARHRAHRAGRCHGRRARAGGRRHAHAKKHHSRSSRRGAANRTPSAESASASISAVLATPCANTGLTPEAGDLALVRASVLCLINHKRAENGERPLVFNSALQAAAESHDNELIAADYFAHVSPTGETPLERIRDMGYLPSPFDGYVVGENLAWGTYDLSTPQSIANAWFNSPPHLANILEGAYRETGMAVVPAVPSSLAAGAPGATYAQEFGVVLQ